MGSNFYMREKQLKKDIDKLLETYPNIDIDMPRFHICKTSCGWEVLFNKTIMWNSVKEIKDFYDKQKGKYEIVDEYGDVYNWEQFTKRVLEFADDNSKSHIGLDTYDIKYYTDDEGYEFTDYGE